MTSRRDIREGKVEPKVIENGIIVPPALQINEMTLAEHRVAQKGLTRSEAVAAGHRQDEIAKEFGPG